MRILLVLAVALAAACGGSTKNKVDPNAPRPDDVPTVLTCCVVVDDAGTPVYSTIPEDQCPEENRNPVATCEVGPGEVPRPQ